MIRSVLTLSIAVVYRVAVFHRREIADALLLSSSPARVVDRGALSDAAAGRLECLWRLPHHAARPWCAPLAWQRPARDRCDWSACRGLRDLWARAARSDHEWNELSRGWLEGLLGRMLRCARGSSGKVLATGTRSTRWRTAPTTVCWEAGTRTGRVGRGTHSLATEARTCSMAIRSMVACTNAAIAAHFTPAASKARRGQAEATSCATQRSQTSARGQCASPRRIRISPSACHLDISALHMSKPSPQP